MKTLSGLLLLVCLVFSMAACSDDAGLPGDDDGAVLAATVAYVSDSFVLLAGENSGELYSIPPGAELEGADSLEPGMSVDVGYNGAIMESYPMGLGGSLYIKVKDSGNDIVGLYSRVLEDLYDTDTGLNGGIDTLAVDFSAVSNLNDGEKSALIYLFGGRYGLSVIAASYDELCEQGLISEEQPYFETGLLFTIEDTEERDGRFTFSASKWRSGTGAYGYENCTAKGAGSTWTYSVGSEWIS